MSALREVIEFTKEALKGSCCLFTKEKCYIQNPKCPFRSDWRYLIGLYRA